MVAASPRVYVLRGRIGGGERNIILSANENNYADERKKRERERERERETGIYFAGDSTAAMRRFFSLWLYCGRMRRFGCK